MASHCANARLDFLPAGSAQRGHGLNVLGVGEHVHGGDALQRVAAAKKNLEVACLRLDVAADVDHALGVRSATPWRNSGVLPARGGSMSTTSKCLSPAFFDIHSVASAATKSQRSATPFARAFRSAHLTALATRSTPVTSTPPFADVLHRVSYRAAAVLLCLRASHAALSR